MAQRRHAKDLIKRTERSSSRIQLASRPIAVLDAEHYDNEHGNGDSRHHLPTEKNSAPVKFNFKDLLTEASAGLITTAAKQRFENTPTPRIPSPYDPLAPGMVDNDPAEPLLSLQGILARLSAITNRRNPEDDTKLFEHNPHLLYHMLTGAPYTVSFCKRCTQHTLCRIHRQTDQNQTSVSLCKHVRMNLYWAVNDPYNDKCSWSLVMKDYTYRDPELAMEHRDCKPYRPSSRVWLLAERMVEDMRYEELRGNVKRAAGEIHSLVSAWEYAIIKRMQKHELKRKMEERKHKLQKENERMAQQRLTDILQGIENSKEKASQVKSTKRRRPEVSHDEVGSVVRKKAKFEDTVNYIEERKVRTITPPPEYVSKPAFGLPDFAQLTKLPQSVLNTTEQMQTPAPPQTSAPFSEFATKVELPITAEPEASPTTVHLQTTPSPTLSQTRQRSSPRIPAIERRRNSPYATSPPLSISSSKPKKSVSFTPAVLSSLIVERKIMTSPPYQAEGRTNEEVSNKNNNVFVKGEIVFKGRYEVEDEVDYEDGEIEG